MAFHVVTDVASLKHLGDDVSAKAVEAFHVVTDVASLKLSWDAPAKLARLCLPRRHRRGLIEARPISRGYRCCRVLPRRHRRGLIEASPSASSRADEGSLPRRHRRGLIEATTSTGSRRRGCPRLPRRHRRGLIEAVGRRAPGFCAEPFHVVTDVASLKLGDKPRALASRICLPRRHRRGLIEARRRR